MPDRNIVFPRLAETPKGYKAPEVYGVDRERLVRESLDTPDFGDIFQAAFMNDTLTAALGDAVRSAQFEADPDFTMSAGQMQQVLKEYGLPSDASNIFAGARSWEHARWLAGRTQRELDNSALVARGGGEGILGTLAATVADPVGTAISVAAAPVGLVSRGTRLARIGKSALAAGTSEGVIASVLADQRETWDSTDILTSVLGGALIGGPLGGLGRGLDDPADRLVGEMIDNLDATTQRELFGVGAAKSRHVSNPLYENNDLLKKIDPDAPKEVTARFRQDPQAVAGRSNIPLARGIGLAVGGESTGYRKQSVLEVVKGKVSKVDKVYPIAQSAWERGDQVARTVGSKWLRKAVPLRDKYLAENHSFLDRRFSLKGQQKFWKDVGLEVRGITTGNAHARQASEAVKDAFEELLGKMKQAGVKGVQDIPTNRNYLPRILNQNAYRDALRRFGEEGVLKIFTRAIRRAQPDMEPATAKKLANAHVRSLSQHTQGMDINMAYGLKVDDLTYLRESLTGVLDETELEALLNDLTVVKEGKPFARLKGRMQLDETTKLTLRDQNTGERVPFNLVNLFENDAEQLLNRYARSASGWIGMAERAGIYSKGDWDKAIKLVQSQAHELGIDPKTDVDNLQFMFNATTGVPLEKGIEGNYAKIARTLRNFTYTTTLNQAGAAQLPEFVALAGAVGFRNMAAHMPAMREVIALAKSGKVEDEFAEEMELLVGAGTDRLRHQASSRYDEFGHGAGMDSAVGRLVGDLDDFLQQTSRITGDISGMAGVTILGQRIGVKALAQKFLNQALGTTKVTKAAALRLRSMGVSEDLQERIFGQLRKHVSVEDSKWVRNKKIKRINPAAWDDREALDVFTAALHREVTRAIQENSPLTMPQVFSSSTTAKLLIQFRTFMMNAWVKQSLHLGKHAAWDMPTMAATSFAAMMGGMAYVAQTGLNYSGDPEKLEKRLALQEIGKAAFQRTGVSSLLPAIVDTGFQIGGWGEYAPFQYGRTSELSTGLVTGAAPKATVDKLLSLPRLHRLLVDPDYKLSQKDWRNMTGLVPVAANAWGFRTFHSWVSSQLPKKSIPTD